MQCVSVCTLCVCVCVCVCVTVCTAVRMYLTVCKCDMSLSSYYVCAQHNCILMWDTEHSIIIHIHMPLLTLHNSIRGGRTLGKPQKGQFPSTTYVGKCVSKLVKQVLLVVTVSTLPIICFSNIRCMYKIYVKDK